MLSSISLTSFRGIQKLVLQLGQRTYIMGENGSGKTHILDAIHLLSGSHPIYGGSTLEIGTQFEGIFTECDLAKTYRMVRDNSREFFVMQGAKITRPKYMQALPWRTVHISPFDMNLLYFAPSMRRDYIDLILSRIHAQFPAIRRDYDLTMRQRNALLKKIRDGEAKREDLNFWDQKFAEYADTYALYRTQYRDYICNTMSKFPVFFTKYNILFRYESNWINELDRRAFIEGYLRDNRERDILTGHTHIGPHRDDWGFTITHNNNVHSLGGSSESDIHPESTIPVESYLSRGEMKMLLLGLKMIETNYITSIMHLPVILLVDDIFAELDDTNSQAFLNSLIQYQIILTSQKPIPDHKKYSDFICINLSNV